jgi:hypothetical protein
MTPKILAALPATAALLAPATAAAHVSIHPNSVPAGAFVTLDVRVPGEQAGAHVSEVDMLMPAGVTGLSSAPVPGWSVRVLESKPAQIVWRWTGPLDQVDEGQFIELPLSVAMPDAAGSSMQFKTVQTYSNGKRARWIEPALEDESPAPRVNLTARGGALLDLAGEEAGPRPGQQAPGSASGARPVSSAAPGASRGLAITALAVGALGLLAGLGGLLAARRTRPT